MKSNQTIIKKLAARHTRAHVNMWRICMRYGSTCAKQRVFLKWMRVAAKAAKRLHALDPDYFFGRKSRTEQ